MAYVTLNVDLYEIYDELDRFDKGRLFDMLCDDGFGGDIIEESRENTSLMNGEFLKVCTKLSQSYYRMSKEDEETIVRIMKKYEFY